MVKIDPVVPDVKSVKKKKIAPKKRQRVLVITKCQLVFLQRNVINLEFVEPS